MATSFAVQAFAAEDPKPPRKPETPKARFASAETSLKVETTSATFRLRLRMEAPEKDEVGRVSVDVPALLDASGKAVPLKCELQGKPCSQGVSMPGFSSALVDLSADLPSPGEYSTWVMLTFPGGSDTRQLTVVRKLKPTATFSVPGVEPGTDGIVWLTVADTAGVTTKLRAPSIAALTRNQPNRPKVQASFDKVVAFTEDGQPLPDTFDLPAETSRRIKLEFHGLEPGNYEGKLILGSVDSGRHELTVSLSKRLAMGYAFAAILAGVLLSHFLHDWASTRRPMLMKRRDLLAVREAFEAFVSELDVRDAVERRVIAALRWGLQEPEQELLEGTLPPNFDDTLGRVKHKVEVLPTWISARRRVQGLEPAKLRAQFQGTLDNGQAYLLAQRAGANDDQVVATLMGLETSISSAVRAELRIQVGALRTDVEEYIKATSNAGFGARLRNVVRPKLDATEGRIENDDPEAAAALNDARLEYAKALAEDLATTLSGPPAAPFALDKTDDDWIELRRHVTALLENVGSAPSSEAPRAIEAYELAYRDYIAGLVAKAKRLTEDQEKIAAAIRDAPLRGELTSRLGALRVTLDGVNQRARDRQLREAAREWERAWSDYVAIEGAVARAGGGPTLGGVIAGKPTGVMNTGGTLPEGVSDRSEPTPATPAVWARAEREGIGSRIRHGDWIFTAAVALIAVGLGLKVLWIDNPAWGGYDDWLIAVLWGLGLHQGSSGAFEGLAGLKAKLAK